MCTASRHCRHNTGLTDTVASNSAPALYRICGSRQVSYSSKFSVSHLYNGKNTTNLKNFVEKIKPDSMVSARQKSKKETVVSAAQSD